MSRIGRKPVAIPGNVKVALSGQKISVTGPKGTLSVNVHPEVKVQFVDAEKVVKFDIDKTKMDDRFARALWGANRALVQNAVNGVVSGYEKVMQVVGTGWTAQLQGKNLKLVCGLANPIIMPIPDGLTITVDKAVGDTTPVKVVGIDRQLVGQFAAAMRQKRKPEPYNGKGIKYSTETIKKKQGKQFGA